MSLSQFIQRVKYHLYNPDHAKWLCPLLLATDAALCGLIIWKVPYTEIDWKTYMQHVEVYISGERDYYYYKGDTGPLVYPGLHLYIYRGLHYLTDGGENILKAQIIFALLYLSTLAVVMACYRRAKAPAFAYPLLILSKRLHSIYLLRLFNDCFAVGFLWTSVYFYQQQWWTIGSIFFSAALGVKMSILIVVPALALILLLGLGRERATTQVLVIGQLQILWGFEFIRRDPYTYFPQAFQLNRQFLYQWTVNWRFIEEKWFLSREFSVFLLVSHVVLLVLFGVTRWIKPSGRSLWSLIKISWSQPGGPYDQHAITSRLTPNFILTTLFTANTIGMLYARSLHYQFYCWTAWATPWLLAGGARFDPRIALIAWAAQEWAWNRYPSTPESSMVVVLMLALQARGVFSGTEDDFKDVKAEDGPILEIRDERGHVKAE